MADILLHCHSCVNANSLKSLNTYFSWNMLKSEPPHTSWVVIHQHLCKGISSQLNGQPLTLRLPIPGSRYASQGKLDFHIYPDKPFLSNTNFNEGAFHSCKLDVLPDLHVLSQILFKLSRATSKFRI